MTLAGRDAVVIGGGFYGCCIAEHLAGSGWKVTLLEQHQALLQRASYNNQARLHGGYHYPRSFSTAYRSRLNMHRFWREFEPAIVADFVKLYAVARHNSKVTARQFEVFCGNIEAPLKPAADHHARLFNPDLVAAVYEVEEYAFDADVLKRLMAGRLAAAGVGVALNCKVLSVRPSGEERFDLRVSTGEPLSAALVVNCTYSGLNRIEGLTQTRNRLKHEIAELALVEPPPALANLGITVMDGPFFSMMPFPDRRALTLTHVRYTPHGFWLEGAEAPPDPDAALAAAANETRVRYMITDAARFMPAIRDVRSVGSLLEVKTVLVKNELDDGRPILLEALGGNPRLLGVLGGKLDNIYDIFAALDEHMRHINDVR